MCVKPPPYVYNANPLVSCVVGDCVVLACTPFQDTEKQKKRLKRVNGTLKEFSLMGYWSRPGVGIKQGDGKSVP